MESARLERTTIDFESPDGALALRAVGTVVTFDGFFALYQEGRDDEEDESERRLPKVDQGARAKAQTTVAEQHFTQPPPRYTEASLVKKMEELGIGRPSTYASILSVLREREYVRMDQKRFVPEDKGRVVIAFLENFFSRYVQYDFTADLEDQLDKVSAGDLDWKELLRRFWQAFSGNVEDIADLRIGQVIEAMNEALGPHIFPPRADGKDARLCPSCNDGTLSLRLGKHGAFVGCSNYPDCRYTRTLSGVEQGGAVQGDGAVGEHPETGAAIHLKDGRFGPYLEMAVEGEDKPRRGSLPKGWSPSELTLEKAVMLIDLPRKIGVHPEDKEEIEAGIGRYGPFVRHGKTYANLDSVDDVFEIGLNRAIDLIAQKKANPRGRGAAAAPLRELGAHPDNGEPVNVMSGRYGPYVKNGKVNATLPKGMEPETVTMEQAVALIAEKAAKGGGAKRAGARKSAAKKAPAKKPAAKKTGAKKAGSKAKAK